MNRLKTLFFTLLLILVFTACEGNKEEDTTLPTFRPIVNKTIPFGLAFDPLEDVTAHDNIDGDITANVECIIYDSYGTEAFDVNVTDVYTQICTIRDAAGNTESTERIITVQDELIGAVISGVKDTTIGIGVYFDPMENLEIIDKLDGNITEDVVINIYNTDTPNEQVESIDTSDLSSYYIDYIIINSLDITTELRIQVDVIDETGPVITASDISHGNDVLHDLLSGVSANDEFYGPISEITYTIYDSSNNVVEYTDYIYGEFTIVYEAVDPSGNVGTKEVSFELLDYYPPHISFFNGNLIIFPGDTINLEDNLSYYDESDDTLIISYEITNLLTSTIVTDLTETDFGYYIVVAEATDKSGVSAQTYFYLTITTGDMVTLDSPIYNAEVILTDFYGYIIAGFRTIEEVCEIYVTDVPFEVNMSYEECISGVSDFKTKVSERSLINTTIEVIDGITYYTTEVEFFRPDENVIKEITYHLVSYEHSLKVYIVFDSDPFDVEYPISVYNPQFEMVDDSLATFYNNMLSSTSLTPTQFCEDFVVNTVYNTMTLNECVEYVEAVNSSILQYYIVSYEAITIPFGDGPDLNGYEAVIDVSRTSLSQIVTVQFIFFRQGDNESISFIDGFFSSDFMYDLKFAHGTPSGYSQTNFMVKPQVGDFYIFPAELFHCVYPFKTKEERRSFSVNFTFVEVPKETVDKQ